jgi:hypothetical protein
VAPIWDSKPYRCTEEAWRRKTKNIRSTLWNGERPGAPFTAACLTLLATNRERVWPWTASKTGIIVEAFPAAQIAQWGWPRLSYTKDLNMRGELISRLGRRVAILPGLRTSLESPADAVDAVISAFAGIAVIDGCVASIPSSEANLEGWIAVAAAPAAQPFACNGLVAAASPNSSVL